MRQQFADLNVTIRQKKVEEELFSVMAFNAPSLDAFMACNTQWRIVSLQTGMIWIGLDYAACDVALRHMNAPAHVFGDLRVIEEAVLPILNGGGE